MSTQGNQPRFDYYPIFLNIRRKNCIVVGGGAVALRKVGTLLECGAYVTVISPIICPELMPLEKAKIIIVLHRKYEPGDLKGAFMAIAAASESDINQKVADEAKQRKIPINVADNREQSDFIVPACLSRGDLVIAISTAGKSPALARKIRDRLEQFFGEEYAAFANLVAEVRSELENRAITVGSDDWQEALDLDLLTRLLRNGQREKAKSVLLSKLTGLKDV